MWNSECKSISMRRELNSFVALRKAPISEAYPKRFVKLTIKQTEKNNLNCYSPNNIYITPLRPKRFCIPT